MGLDPARWARIEELYEQAATLAPADRAAYLSAACADDASLAAEVLQMIDAGEGPGRLSIERLVPDDHDPGHGDPRIGARIGAWRVDTVLGRGGSGIVYLVSRADGQYEQQAALKLVAASVVSAETATQFDRERRILARLVHPNIARLIDGGVTPDHIPYLVMEYVDGTPLSVYCDDRRLSVDARLHLCCVVADAVEHAHRALVVHRDLKPSNIYVSTDGDVKLLDFGIAKLLAPEGSEDAPHTRTEHRAFTPAYAAPEQLRHDPVTTATDVYSLGVVVYELLTGTRPHDVDGLSPAQAERVVTADDPAMPSVAVGAAVDAAERRSTTPERLASRLRGDLDRICLMALDKEPARRYQSARLLGEDIQRFLDGRPVSARPATAAYRLQRFVKRHRAGVAAAISLVLLIVAFAVVAGIQARLVAAERDRARDERNKAQEIVQLLVNLFRASNPEVVPEGDRQTIGVFLKEAETRVLDGLGANPDARASMRHVLGQVHSARSDFPKARTLLEQAVADLRTLRGSEDREAIDAQVDLARLLLTTGDATGARTLLEDASARALRTVGERDALTGRVLFHLAETYDDADHAQPLYERSLAIRRAVLGPYDPEVAATIKEIAVQHMRREQYADARARFEEALAIVGRFNGGRHVVAHDVTSDYAALLYTIGDYANAETQQRRALQLAIELIGPQSLAVANNVSNLATVLANQGRLDAAVEMGKDAHARLAALVGPEHFRAANAARNVAMMLLWTDRPIEARPWIETAIRASEVADGPDSRNTIYMRAQRATITQELGDAAGAVRQLRTAVSELEKLGPTEGHYMLADVRLTLGRALLSAGQAPAAEAEFRQALEFRQRTFPAASPGIVIASCELARALAASGRTAEARSLLETCAPKLRQQVFVARSTRLEVTRLWERLK